MSRHRNANAWHLTTARMGIILMGAHEELVGLAGDSLELIRLGRSEERQVCPGLGWEVCRSGTSRVASVRLVLVGRWGVGCCGAVFGGMCGAPAVPRDFGFAPDLARGDSGAALFLKTRRSMRNVKSANKGRPKRGQGIDVVSYL